MRNFARITWNAYLRGQVNYGNRHLFHGLDHMAAIGLNNSLGLGILAGVLEFLPIIGPLVSAGVAILVALFQDSNWLGLTPLYYAVAVAVVMLVIQQLENNLLVPRVRGRCARPARVAGDDQRDHGRYAGWDSRRGAGSAGSGIDQALWQLCLAQTARPAALPEEEPPPKPKRGASGLTGRWRLIRRKLSHPEIISSTRNFMTTSLLYPLTFDPAFKDYPLGRAQY